MRLDPWLVGAAACAAFAACTTLDSVDRRQALRASDPERQILVMLSEWPAQHYQPGAPQMPRYRAGAAHARELQTMQDLARQYAFRVVSDWPMPSLGVRCFVGEVAAGQTPQEVVARVAADPRVESAQVVQVFQLMGHNDPYYDLQTSATLLKL